MQRTKNTLIICFLAISFFAGIILAHDYVPGKNQDHPIILKGGDLYTVSNGVLTATDLLFEDGRITQIGVNLTPPDNTEVIDVSGKRVYPGLISPVTTLGLVEISSIDASNDTRERGQITANTLAYTAYNPDSEIIPTVRSNGITTAQIIPSGGTIRGRSCILNLDGWTIEDAMEKKISGLHISWPRSSAILDPVRWMQKSAEEQKKEIIENVEQLHEMFDDAYAYHLSRQADPDLEIDLRWEAMLPLFSGEMPVFIHANDVLQIELAIDFAKKYKLKMILVGGGDAWRVDDLLRENDIPVILRRVQAWPMRTDDPYDMSYSLPSTLQERGIKYCLSVGWAPNERNLPFQAGQAVGFGLTEEQALRAITLSTAEILGVEQDLGSLDVGKKATIIVSDGDVLDIKTNKIIWEFIEGRKVDLDNKHEELFRKYQEKTL